MQTLTFSSGFTTAVTPASVPLLPSLEEDHFTTQFDTEKCAYSSSFLTLSSQRELLPHLSELDLGGDGDCFFRCFKHMSAVLTAAGIRVLNLPITEYYNLLNLPVGTWIEDIHISALCFLTRVTVVVVSEVNGLHYATQFGSYGPLYCIRNVGLYHFTLLMSDTILERNRHRCRVGFSTRDQQLTHLQSCIDNYALTHPEEASSSSSSSAYSDQEDQDSGYMALTLTDDPAVIYSYLIDVSHMSFPDESSILDVFYHTHNLFIRSLNKMNSENKYPPSDYLKAYYKFRHNVFSVLCRFQLQQGPLVLDTDVPLTDWLPQSKKTPDFILVGEGGITIYEFTVGNTYGRIDYVKGGGSFDLKYSSECKEIEQLHDIRAEVKMIPAVLNSYNMNEVQTLLGCSTDHFYLCLQRFYETANVKKEIISNNYVHSSMTYLVNIPMIPGVPKFERPELPRILMLPADVVSGMANDHPNLLVNLSTLDGGVKIEFNLKILRYKVYQEKGGSPVRLVLSNATSSFVSTLRYVKIRDSDRLFHPWELRGTVPVSVPFSRKEEKLAPWDYIPIVDRFYSKNRPTNAPTHGELTHISAENLFSISEVSQVNFTSDYFDQLSSMDPTPLLKYKGKEMLYNSKMDAEEVSASVAIFSEKITADNALDLVRAKPTFMFPLPTCPLNNAHLDLLNRDLMRAYLSVGKGKYTKSLLSKCMSNSFVRSEKREFNADTKAAMEQYHLANSEYYTSVLVEHGMKSFKTLPPESQKKLRPLYDNLRATKKVYLSLLGKGKSFKGDRILHLKCKKGSTTLSDFEHEMRHYQSSEGKAGIGMNSDSEKFGTYLKKLCDRLFLAGFHKSKYPDLYGRPGDIGPKFLTELKQRFHARFETFRENFVTSTLYEQIVNFVSRLAKFLFNESLKTYNSDYVKADNLGLDEVIVLCRGGSKLYKHQRSRLFRVLFYMDPQDLTFSGYKENDHFEYIQQGSRVFVATPWSQVHQDVLFDYMSLPARSFNQLYSSYTRTHDNFDQPISRLSVLPLLLSLHNRRKTEKFMHNSRYLIVNPLGLSANLTGIIASFSDVNYSHFDAFLRYQLKTGYEVFAGKLLLLRGSRGKNIDRLLDELEITDLWLNEPLKNTDSLTLFIYITYMMTKAPVNASLEQAGNLWEILEDVKSYSETHPDVEKLEDESQRFNVLEFNPNVYKDDFTYDPVYCQYLGHYMAGYLNSTLTPGELSNKWDTIAEADFSNIANSNGLRGWQNNNFFGKKGYEIVFEKVDELINDEEIASQVDLYMKLNQTDSAEAIKKDRITSESIEDPYKNLLFHIVHKIQRGGGREIFCMDLNTKAQQNPLERFFKYICGKIPNEFISIKSNKRHGIIHSDFYEKPAGKWVSEIVRWVLDCRRWAPHSVFQKYVHFITGLSVVLPPAFLKKFFRFADKMFEKSFITRAHVLSKMMRNERFKRYEGMLEPMGQIAGAFQMTVKFSFVMGIFNYLSTLMHAANQLVASECIRNSCLTHNLGLVVMDPKCHSDDSVVTSYHENPVSVETTVKLYDWFLKGANHMLSVKKSQINKNVYLEFLSILYLFDRFLPVYPKFISSIPFKPTDMGLPSDVSFAVSQSIELMSNGGTHEECYLIMKTTARYVRQLYNLNKETDLPHQLFGEVDSHPIELLFAGSKADLLRWYLYKPDAFWSYMNELSNLGFIDLTSGDFTMNWDMSAMLSNRMKRLVDRHKGSLKSVAGAEWTVKNNKLGNSTLNLLWYILRLSDRKFLSSLMHEPEARRFSRIFGAGGYRAIKSADGRLYPVETVIAALDAVQIKENYAYPTNVDSFLRFSSRRLEEFYSAIEGAEITSVEPSNLKDKPVVFYTGETALGNVNLSANEYVSYVKEPAGYKLLGRMRNPYREASAITEYIRLLGVEPDDMTPEMLYQVARKVLSNQESVYRIVCSTAGDNRVVNTNVATVDLIAHSSLPHTKLVIKNKAAHEVDWSKKLTSGKVPGTAKQYMKTYWVCSKLTEYGLQDLDIYISDPFEEERILANNLTDEWKAILLTSVSLEASPLAELSHWTYWQHEQIKIGSRWFGDGVCIVKIPECTVRIAVTSSTTTRLHMYSNHLGYFSSSSSWYLNNVLQFSGINSELVNPEYFPANTTTLGYSIKDKLYGIGYPKMFDYVVANVEPSEDPTPIEFYKVLKHRKARSHYVYEGEDRDYYIDFFIPTEDPVAISFKGVFDIEKLRNCTDPKVINFIQRLSVDVGGYMEIDKDYLLDNIGDTTTYRMLFDAPSRQNVIDNSKTEGYLVESLISWKKSHPEFGFPNEEDMVQLLKESDRPPFPENVLKHLLALGESNISDHDYRMLLMKLCSMPPEEQSSFLTRNFAFLDSKQRAGALVMATRSKLIYTHSEGLGERVLEILLPLCSLIAECMETGKLISPTLDNIVRNLRLRNVRGVHRQLVFQHIYAQVVMEGIFTKEENYYSPSIKRFGKCLEELIDVGMLTLLNSTPTEDPVLKTVDFNVPKNVFLGWVANLLYTHYRYRYGMANRNTNFRRLESEKDMRLLSPILSRLIRMKKPGECQSIHLLFKKKRLRLQAVEGKPGITRGPFFVMDDDSQFEFDDGYDFDDEIEEEMIEDPDGEVEDMALVNVPNVSLMNIMSKRGTARNVFYSCSYFKPDCNQAYGHKIIFKKNQHLKDLSSYINSTYEFIFYVGADNFKGKIEGYSRLSWEAGLKIMLRDTKLVKYYRIEGKDYTSDEVEADTALVSKLNTFNNYFKKVTTAQSEEELERVKSLVETYNQFEKNDHLEKEMARLEEIKKRKRIEKESQEGVTAKAEVAGQEEEFDMFEGLNLADFIAGVQEAVEIGSNEGQPVKQYITGAYSNYKYKDTMKLLTDLVVRSEFNCVFPGYLDKLMNGEVALSSNTRRRIIGYANGQIALMPRMMKPKYRKLLFVVKCLLSEVEDCRFMANEDFAFAALIDNLFMTALEYESDSAEEASDLIPGSGDLKIRFDLSRIL